MTPLQKIELFRLMGIFIDFPLSRIDADIMIMKIRLNAKMRKLERTMDSQVGYLQSNYGYPASLDLKKPAYYDKMISIGFVQN